MILCSKRFYNDLISTDEILYRDNLSELMCFQVGQFFC